MESSDDEETIAQEETLDSGDKGKKSANEKEEIDALHRESMIPIEDLLDSLPPEYFETMGKPVGSPEEEVCGNFLLLLSL